MITFVCPIFRGNTYYSLTTNTRQATSCSIISIANVEQSGKENLLNNKLAYQLLSLIIDAKAISTGFQQILFRLQIHLVIR